MNLLHDTCYMNYLFKYQAVYEMDDWSLLSIYFIQRLVNDFLAHFSDIVMS